MTNWLITGTLKESKSLDSDHMEEITMMENRCFRCMRVIETDVCPFCGHDNTAPENITPTLLAPGTVVGKRYQIGIALDRNGEGVSYIAYDTAVQRRVRLREFFPSTLAHRAENETTIRVNQGCEVQYKALMTDFVELSRQLIALRMQETSLLRAFDVFTDNATIYTVYEDVDSITLTSYLADHVGDFSWQQVRKMFKPLFDTVILLNERGIVHRGISTDTILVTANMTLRLKGICTAAVRAINSEVKPELFDGYAAPEQYEKCKGHGVWTDVYALSAVLYRVLSGVTPQRADWRTQEDRLLPLSLQKPSVMPEVSDVIMQGLALQYENRIRSVRTLRDMLYEIPVTFKPIHLEDDEEEKPAKKNSEKKSKEKKSEKKEWNEKHKLPVWLIVLLVSLPIMLILFFAAYILVLGGNTREIYVNPSSDVSVESSIESSDLSSDSEETSVQSKEETESSQTVANVTVDNFVGKFYDDIVSAKVYTDSFNFKKKEEVFDDNADIGMIIEQSVDAGSTVPIGTQIELTVSKGPQYVELPPLTDNNGNPISASSYRDYLESKGLSVTVKNVSDPDYKTGEVVSVDPSVGTVIDRSKTSTVTIYAAK